MPGSMNVVLPVVTGGGGLWHQSCQEHLQAKPQACEIKPGTSLQGSFVPYTSHEPLTFDARQWHSSCKSSAPQLLLIGYTPRMLHKLDPASRCTLWKQGMTFLPGTKDEYWSTNCDRSILTRHHPCPRRATFAPTNRDVLPFPLQCIGQVRYCEQWFVKGDKKTSIHLWKNGRGKASAIAWTGKSVFTLCAPDPQQAEGGDLCPKSELKNEPTKPKNQGKGEVLKSLRPRPGSEQPPVPSSSSSSSRATSRSRAAAQVGARVRRTVLIAEAQVSTAAPRTFHGRQTLHPRSHLRSPLCPSR